MSAASATSVRQDATALLQHVQVSAAGSTAQLQDPWCSSRIRGAAACNLTADRLSANTQKASVSTQTNNLQTCMGGVYSGFAVPGGRQAFQQPGSHFEARTHAKLVGAHEHIQSLT